MLGLIQALSVFPSAGMFGGIGSVVGGGNARGVSPGAGGGPAGAGAIGRFAAPSLPSGAAGGLFSAQQQHAAQQQHQQLLLQQQQQLLAQQQQQVGSDHLYYTECWACVGLRLIREQGRGSVAARNSCSPFEIDSE